MNNKFKIIILFLIFALSEKAQTIRISEKHFVKEKKILFRISLTDRKTFDILRKGPLKVTRFELKNGSQINEIVLEKKLMPYWEGDTLNWMRLIRKNKDKAAFVYQTLFQNQTDAKLSVEKKERQDKMLFDLLLLSCDLDAEIATACGLLFPDSTINNNSNYVYKIELYTSPTTSKELLKATVNSSVLSVNKKISDLQIKSKNKIATLKWKAVSYSDEYSGYNIERSEDSTRFIKINSAPVILFASQFEKNKEFITCQDTMPALNKRYYYRIKGINFFGEESDPSNMVVTVNFPAINSSPLLDSIRVIQNRYVNIKWRMENNTETTLPKNYLLMRSESDKGEYKVIYESKSKLEFLDTKPLSSNFYKVAAVSFNNDTLYSYSRMILITDTIPPSIPLDLNAAVTKKGIVTIRWKKNPESDLQGYKIFKANSQKEEFVQLNNKFCVDTFFVDTLNLKNLSKKVYYALSSCDNMFNNSVKCIPIEVTRPDTIAPVSPILNSAYPDLHGVTLHFLLSRSEDVAKHVITRKNEKENTSQDIKIILTNDSITSFVDTMAQLEQTYNYQITAYDADNNFSSSKSIALNFENGFRKKLTNINYMVDRTQKNISLSWTYKETGIEKFILYRGKEKEDLTIIKTIDGNTLSYIDKTPNIGNIYEYRIKVVLYNGAESIISDPIKITY